MKSGLATIMAGGLAIIVVLYIFLVSERRDRRTWEAEKTQLLERLAALEDRMAALAEASNHLAAQLAASRQAQRSNAAVVAQAAAEPVPHAETNAPAPRAYQAQAYVGQQAIGPVWVVPTNVRRDPKTGRTLYEPVIRLPESARSALTTYVTNVVERPVPVASAPVVQRETYVERAVPWRSPWWWLPPVAVTYERPSAPPRAPSVPSVPAVPSRRVSPGPWAPVVGAPQPAGRPSGLYVPPGPGAPGLYVPPGVR